MNLLTVKMDEDDDMSTSETAAAQSMDIELSTATAADDTAADVDADVDVDDVFSSELSPHSAATAAANPESLCRVCGDGGAAIYFGALVCVPCKVLPVACLPFGLIS